MTKGLIALTVLLTVLVLTPAKDCSVKSLGCWTDNAARAIAGGIRFNSDNPIVDCHKFAKEQGFSFFAVQYSTECFTAADAGDTFGKYGQSENCATNGRGGGWAQNVYQIECDKRCESDSLGCWTDSPTRAIDGGIRFNSGNPIDDCQNFAKAQGFSYFAVQYSTECFTAANAGDTYGKYGESAGCADNGRGGGWAQNVYRIQERQSVGCWTDDPTRAIDGGIRFNSNNPIEDCHNYAKAQGFSFFAVQYSTECFTAANAGETFMKYGESAGCAANGRGGTWAQNVYLIGCN